MSTASPFPHTVLPCRLDIRQASLDEANLGIIWENIPNTRSLYVLPTNSEVTLVEGSSSVPDKLGEYSHSQPWFTVAHSRAHMQRAKWMNEHYHYQNSAQDPHDRALASPSSPSRLKANATPFIPTNLQRSISPHEFSLELDSPAHTSLGISWYPAFLSGVGSSSHENRASAAAAMIDDRVWNLEAIILLARELSRHAAEPLSDEPGVVAKFAKAVYGRLREVSNEWMARALVRHLRNSCADMLECLCKNSHLESTFPDQLASAMRLASFIGDLFTEHFFAYADVKICMDVLLQGCLTPAQMQILYGLLASATSALWENDASHTDRDQLWDMLDLQVANDGC